MDFIAYLILAARDRGQGKWIFPIVLAVFWAVGGILKARANKASTMRDEEKEQQHQPELAHPQPRRKRAELFEPGPVTVSPAPVQKRRKVHDRIIQTNIEGLKSKIDGITRKETPQQSLETSGPILRFEEPDELKKAILYHEILGKPVSLKESQSF
ncbi:hypothetical protein ACFL3G_07980 [Planctomycetota bacterium]